MKLELENVLKSSLVNKFVAALGGSIEYGRWEFQYRKYREQYEVHPTFKFGGPGIILYGDGRIVLGERSFINRYGSISSSTGCELVIGKNCAIGPFVFMSTANRSANQDFSMTRMMTAGDVRVDDDCWIGAGVFINQGVSVGSNSVVGANSVVTRDIPPHSIAAGAPARVIRFKPYLDETRILELTNVYWHSLSSALKRESLHRYPELKSLKLQNKLLLQRTP
ncbi:MAG: acyltransferase [Candidatus Bathyarchaeia archaeon]|jgi:acetyltransferase-like isoleucine patch superfamily enzyme